MQPGVVPNPIPSPVLQQLLASTGMPGFPLVNATPNILAWTAPNDGNMHRIQVFGCVSVSSAETGGAITVAVHDPAGILGTHTIQAGGAGAGSANLTGEPLVLAPGTTVTVAQGSALSAGAAVLYAEIWGS
jgi:hypothetical protein